MNWALDSQGGTPILLNIKGMLIENNEEFEKQFVNSTKYLSEAGLVLEEKRQADMLKDSSYRNSYNQIWYRELIQ